MHERTHKVNAGSSKPRRPAAAGRSRRAAGFTVLELLIVITIIAILATMFAPRLYGNERREFRLTAERVADLMTMYAKRDHLSQKPIALSFDPNLSQLRLLIYDVDYSAGEQEPDWHVDRHARPVRIPAFVELTNVLADGMGQDISRWPLETRPGQQRQFVELVLTGPDDEQVRISLPPYAVAPTIEGLGRNAGVVRRPINLNAQGRSREDW